MTTKPQTNDNKILLSDDTSSYSSSDDSLFDDTSFIDPINFNGEDYNIESEEANDKPSLEVFLKPAKSRDDQYEGGPFPCSLLCNPYKYDLKVVSDVDNQNGEPVSLTLDLVDSESLQVMQMPPSAGNNAKSVQSGTALTIESVTKVSQKERIIRFSFNLCSFHVQRKSFCLVVKNGEYPLYVSSAFRTYARRRDHHNYNRPSTNVKSEPRLSPRSSSSPEPQLSMIPPIPMFMCQPAFQPSSFTSQRSSPEMFSTLGVQERTSLAIQLMTSLSPMERQAVNFYLQTCGSVSSAPIGFPMQPVQTPFIMSSPVAISNTVMVGGSTTGHPMSSTIRFPKSR